MSDSKTIVFEKAHRAYDRRLVCKNCHTVMDDREPGSPGGEFIHPEFFRKGKHGEKLLKPEPNPCKNAGKWFTLKDLPEGQVEEFERKRVRRAAKRARST